MPIRAFCLDQYVAIILHLVLASSTTNYLHPRCNTIPVRVTVLPVLEDLFLTDEDGEMYDGPPAHPNCACSVVPVSGETEEEETPLAAAE